MTDTFLKEKAVAVPFRSSRMVGHGGEEQSQKMIAIMKEMQSPKKFNSPMRRRNEFGSNLPLPIRSGDTIIQGMPIEIQCRDYLDDEGELLM